jgi:hypothetical protein
MGMCSPNFLQKEINLPQLTIRKDSLKSESPNINEQSKVKESNSTLATDKRSPVKEIEENNFNSFGIHFLTASTPLPKVNTPILNHLNKRKMFFTPTNKKSLKMNNNF